MSKMEFVDLFAGAGGASFGLTDAGFECKAAIEIDDWAADTYELNHPATKVIRSDIQNISSDEFKKFKGIDLIVGGPPCQGFSIAASNRRNKNDPRNKLYLHYIRAVEAIRPKFIIVENVKEILKFRLDDGGLLLSDFINKGAGIGLLLVKGFLEKNGGEIWVESAIGEGSSFYFTLPIEKPLTVIENLSKIDDIT